MLIYVITGMSGAGKSLVVRQFEDMGFFCVDNLPPSLIPTVIEMSLKVGGKMDKLALVMDIRGGEFLNELIPCLDEVERMEIRYKVIFLDASDKTLLKRFKESRRTHPLAPEGRITTGIVRERESLETIRNKATFVIDTSNFMPAQLRDEIVRLVGDESNFIGIVINIITFGFKHGLPMDSDLVFDVRFTPNPFYIPEMKNLTGLNKMVSDYVFGFPETVGFVEKLTDILGFLIPYYKREGKSRLEIGIGCTGGKHRSVAIGEEMSRRLTMMGERVMIEHRDIAI